MLRLLAALLLFAPVAMADDPKPASGIEFHLCGKPSFAVVSFSDGRQVLLASGDEHIAAWLFDQLPEDKRAVVTITPHFKCPVQT